MNKIEKMFLDLNSVLVKFWIEQGRPDKETKIALLERMLNWYKKMGYVTPQTLSEEPDTAPVDGNELLYVADKSYKIGWRDCKRQMLKDAVEGEIQMRYSGCLCAKTIRAINEDKFKLGEKVRLIIVKEEEK